jgi:hypothetical protein
MQAGSFLTACAVGDRKRCAQKEFLTCLENGRTVTTAKEAKQCSGFPRSIYRVGALCFAYFITVAVIQTFGVQKFDEATQRRRFWVDQVRPVTSVYFIFQKFANLTFRAPAGSVASKSHAAGC